MKALLIIAHGSRNRSANDELRSMAGEVKALAGERLEMVHLAFLNHGRPDIPGGLEDCASAGADTVYVVPYFLNTGVHVATNIPNLVDSAQNNFPATDFRLLPHLGSLPQMPALILDMLPEQP
jgi:sirohydrochlorin ferrochelatase